MAEPQHIADAVLRWFASSSTAQKKHPQSEWTVLAGIVLRVSSAAAADEYRVLATGTGTKCLGRRDLDANGFVINDSHAEIIARRALLRYLYSEALAWLRTGHVHANSIFTPSQQSAKLALKPGHELHLFVSEAPCGDAAIYALRNDVVDAMVEQRLHAGQPRSDLRLTGAKLRPPSKRPHHQDAEDQPVDKRYEQMVGISRVKSGRSDLPPDKQTLSMSCSDKIAVWTAVGVQGTLLLAWFEPLLLSSVVVGSDPSSQSAAAQQRAVERAVRDRVYPAMTDHCVAVHVVDPLAFDRQRAATKAPSPLSLNWTRCEPHWATEDGGLPPSFCRSAGADVEVLMGATGYKQGAKKADKMAASVKQKVASRLCKWNLFRAYTALSQLTASEPKSDTTYSEAKAAVASGSTQQARHQLGAWVGVPSTYKSFKLDPK